jgi:ATP-binding cassette subfamily B protein
MIKNWFLTLFVLLPIPLIVLASLLIWKRLWKSWGRWLSRWARLSSHLNESISGIRVVKAFSQEKREGQRFDQRNHELRDAGIFVDRTWYVFFTTTNFLMSFGVFFVWYIGGRQILGETMTLGALIAFISYLWMLYEPIQWLGELNSFVSRAFAGAERIFEILDKTPEKAEATDAIAMPTLEGRVRFRHVTFGYDRAKPALKDIVLDIEPGEMIGLVGRSGVGKTTLINLVCRFYDPDRGTIEIDGCDMRAIRLADLRRHIGMVHQESFLFSGTIAENIGYSKPGATLADIMEAAMAAEAHDFIVARPDGYNTLVGERGNRLSGGEKQRLAIARAILHNPRILILDEATSSLDTETEKKIQEAIARLVRGRTTLAIAHRLSTLRSADRLVVLDDGKIAEIGTHAELMEKKGFFYQMVKTQQEASASIAVGGGKDASAELVC